MKIASATGDYVSPLWEKWLRATLERLGEPAENYARILAGPDEAIKTARRRLARWIGDDKRMCPTPKDVFEAGQRIGARAKSHRSDIPPGGVNGIVSLYASGYSAEAARVLLTLLEHPRPILDFAVSAVHLVPLVCYDLHVSEVAIRVVHAATKGRSLPTKMKRETQKALVLPTGFENRLSIIARQVDAALAVVNSVSISTAIESAFNGRGPVKMGRPASSSTASRILDALGAFGDLTPVEAQLRLWQIVSILARHRTRSANLPRAITERNEKAFDDYVKAMEVELRWAVRPS